MLAAQTQLPASNLVAPVLEDLNTFKRPVQPDSLTPVMSRLSVTPWEEEVRRHGLALLVDGFLCCRDVGWRKPAREVFAEALRRAGTSAEETIFVGDDVRCDVVCRISGLGGQHRPEGGSERLDSTRSR